MSLENYERWCRVLSEAKIGDILAINDGGMMDPSPALVIKCPNNMCGAWSELAHLSEYGRDIMSPTTLSLYCPKEELFDADMS